MFAIHLTIDNDGNTSMPKGSEAMLNIYIDGDACPVKDEVIRVSADLIVLDKALGGGWQNSTQEGKI